MPLIQGQEGLGVRVVYRIRTVLLGNSSMDAKRLLVLLLTFSVEILHHYFVSERHTEEPETTKLTIHIQINHLSTLMVLYGPVWAPPFLKMSASSSQLVSLKPSRKVDSGCHKYDQRGAVWSISSQTQETLRHLKAPINQQTAAVPLSGRMVTVRSNYSKITVSGFSKTKKPSRYSIKFIQCFYWNG